MDADEAEVRAARLEVLLRHGPVLADADLNYDDLRSLEGIDQRDLDLAGACAHVEAELRAEGFRSIEALAEAIRGLGAPTIGDRVSELPEAEFVRAARRLIYLGWIRPD